ncbi:hypothetical protein K501DRAFT_332930 [Backusella circina FSU 941]|nr:hypothetical protein K501DRAFT_332930 [Backusella circina FSU 941]
MVHRNTPCAECRKHRRKCIRDSTTESCSRCRRLERTCVTNEDIDTSLSNSENAKTVIQQINDLNSTIADLEQQLKLLKQVDQTSSNDQSSEYRIVHYQNQPIMTGDWTLTIQNGALRIETGIKNISDLLLQCPPIQYLSPFQIATDEGLVVQFSPGKNMCLRAFASKLLVKCLRPTTTTGNNNHNTLSSLITLPTSFIFDTRSMIDQLLDIYFQCHNTFHPLIHQPSFLRFYKQLTNPLDSLVCLAICCYVCGAPCSHTLSRFGDLSNIGKYFIGLAKNKLMEQFDLEEKRIENMVSINLLVYYLHTLLLSSECKKLLTISHQITVDLLPWYKREHQKRENVSIECALYSRSISSLVTYQRSMGMEKESQLIMQQGTWLSWISMPDEPAELIDYVGAQNWLVKLCNYSIMSKLKSRTRDVILGHVCTLPLEVILRLDEVINEWWSSLPKRYRICDHWLDSEQCIKNINETTDGVVLISFVNFLIYILGAFSQMLQPKSVADNTVLSIVENLTLERSLYCCRMVMCSFVRANHLDLDSTCRYSLAMKRYLFHIADVLITLSSSSNHIIRDEAKSMFESCILAIESMSFMRLHRVDPAISPLLRQSHIAPREMNDINLSVYFTYPQPWYALVYDMCRYLNSNNIFQNGLQQ